MMKEFRKLVTIRQVASVGPIKGADLIEVIKVDGWEVVAKKGDFRPGDPCVYFEIDSVLPNVEPFLFLTSKNLRTFYNGKQGFLLRTIKLRGQISQGLALPIFAFDPQVFESDDLAESLGVWKYDPPLPSCLSGQVVGRLPSWLQKTDEERVQNIDPTHLKGQIFDVTEKMDGTSSSYWIDPAGNIGCGSRNLELQLSDENKGNSIVRMLFDSGLAGWLDSQAPGTVVQGELCGPGIQGNPYNLKKATLFLFMLQLEERKVTWEWLKEKYDNMITRGLNPNMVQLVPYVGQVNSFNFDELMDLANQKSLIPNAKYREGVVARSVVSGNVSFKVISNSHLLS